MGQGEGQLRAVVLLAAFDLAVLHYDLPAERLAVFLDLGLLGFEAKARISLLFRAHPDVANHLRQLCWHARSSKDALLHNPGMFVPGDCNNTPLGVKNGLATL